MRCVDCESLFEARVNRPRTYLYPLVGWLVTMLLVGIVASVSNTARVDVTWLFVLSAALFFAPFFVAATRSIYFATSRLRFLRQRSNRARLPVNYSEESWFEVGESWSIKP